MADYKNQLREALPDVNKPKRTICEVHREIYDRLEVLDLADDPVIAMLEDAYALGKKMDAKLRQYGEARSPEWYAAERARVLDDTLLKRRARRIERQQQRKAAEARSKK